MDGEERSKGEKGEEKENGEKKEEGEVKEEEVREGVSKVDIVLDCESKKSDAKDVCRQQKATKHQHHLNIVESTFTTPCKISSVYGQ